MFEDEIKKTDDDIASFYASIRGKKLIPLEKDFKPKTDAPAEAPKEEKKEEPKAEEKKEAPAEKKEEKPKIHGVSQKTWSEKPAAERQAKGNIKEIEAGEAPIAPSYEVADASAHQTKGVRSHTPGVGSGTGTTVNMRTGHSQKATQVTTQRLQPPNPKEAEKMQEHLDSVPAIDYEGKEIPTHPKGGKERAGEGAAKTAWKDMVERAQENVKLNEGKKPSEDELGDKLKENPKTWGKFVGRSTTEQQGIGESMKFKRAMELLTSYLFEEINKSLEASVYSDYREDIMQTVTKSFVEDKDIVYDEIIKMSEEEEAPNPLETILKAQIEMSERIKNLTEEFESLKKSKQEEVKVENAIEKKEDAPASPAEDIPKVEKYAEGVPTNVPNHELASDSNASVKSGDVTVPAQKIKEGVDVPPKEEVPKISHNAYHDDTALPHMHKLGKEETNAFEAGKKIGEIEAIKKQVEENGVTAQRPVVVETPLRDSIIEKISADDKVLLNTSWGKLEKEYIQKR